jgi:hypothetical protein
VVEHLKQLQIEQTRQTHRLLVVLVVVFHGQFLWSHVGHQVVHQGGGVVVTGVVQNHWVA